MHFEDVERLLDVAKNAPVPSLHVEEDMRSVDDDVSVEGDDEFWAPQLESDDEGEPLSVKSCGSASSCVASFAPFETMDEFVGPADDEQVMEEDDAGARDAEDLFGFPKVAPKAAEAKDAFLSDPDPKRLFEPLTTTQKKQLVTKLYYPGHETSDNSTMNVDPWLDVEQSKEYVDPATFIGRIFLADSKDSEYLNLQFSRRFMAVACRSLLHCKKHTMLCIKKSNKFKWQQVMRKAKRLMSDYNSRLRDLAKGETANNDALRREALNLKEEANKLSTLIPCRLSMAKDDLHDYHHHQLTNYSSKMDIKLHDLVSIVAVGCKKYLERYANTEEAVEQHRLFITGITNSLNARIQMSACQVMWHLLGYGDDGDYYMSHPTYPLHSLPFLKLLAAEER
ncbi:unnamed protein product [Vitrella brassicaformis CCMP3155]|uniref:Uncharacterized protein n=1 Tax=Vitrella brassicaformis (strain CCMP3155) TaxID=1169540 RepID=A0A0G4ETK6_VITBC|nr:unnamed protein product [Vitrella brassicaformis CCMP3155]|eukprot:CEM01940.1 unnamed protein product [Vitrella brassicaformis CCMP3155]